MEVFSEGRWGTVCNNGENAVAEVVCRQLGYNTSSEHIHVISYMDIQIPAVYQETN